jgi:hypothetical protein
MITLHVNIPFYVLFTTISPNDPLVHFIVNYVAKLFICTISMFMYVYVFLFCQSGAEFIDRSAVGTEMLR